MRLTQKNDFFEYMLPCQNIIGDNQATEISLGETEYTCKKYVVGEAIRQFGLIEDVLEKWHIEDLDKFIEEQVSKKRELNDICWKMEQELAELKQKAIIPKFSVGQEIYIVCDPNRIVTGWKVIDYQYYKQQYVVECKGGIDWIHKDRLFATREEAEKFLRKTLGDR